MMSRHHRKPTKFEDPRILAAYRRWFRSSDRGPETAPNAFIAGWNAAIESAQAWSRIAEKETARAK